MDPCWWSIEGEPMSQAEQQSITLLVLSTSLLVLLRHKQLVPELDAAVLHAEGVTSDCMCKLPDGEHPFSSESFDRQKDTVRKIFDMLPEYDAPFYNGSMIYLCNHILTDLCEKIKDKHKLAMIEPAQKACQELAELFDKNGTDFQAMTTADRLLREIYREIGFSRA